MLFYIIILYMYAYLEGGQIGYIATTIDPRELLPVRKAESHKGTYGRALLITGSPGMAGAAYLAGMAAYRSGCGLVELFTHESNRIILQQLLPEAVMTVYGDEDKKLADKLEQSIRRADSVGLGCGLGLSDQAVDIVRNSCEFAVRMHKPLLADADAITLIGREESLISSLRRQSVVFTPHPKEMTSLTHMHTDEILSDRETIVTSFCSVSGTVCLLKGHRTLVGSPSGALYENHTVNSGMAAGGSGDVLSGLITGLMAQGVDLYDAACLGAWIHGHAGDLAAEDTGEHAMMARDLLESLTEAMWELEQDEDELEDDEFADDEFGYDETEDEDDE